MFERFKKSHSPPPPPPPPMDTEREREIAALLGNDPQRMKDKRARQLATDILDTENKSGAFLFIYSNTSWSATVQGSDLVMQTIDGSGYKIIELAYTPGGIYSIVVQKKAWSGGLEASVVRIGEILKQGTTTAAYGVVSIAGRFYAKGDPVRFACHLCNRQFDVHADAFKHLEDVHGMKFTDEFKAKEMEKAERRVGE